MSQPPERRTGELTLEPHDLVRATDLPGTAQAAYQTYLLVREQILGMFPGRRPAEGGGGLFDASPAMVASLRRHWRALGEADPSGYELAEAALRVAVAGRLRWLQALADERLVVPDQPVLGGFGVEIDGALYNADSLAASESLIALHFAEIVSHLRRAGRGAVVWDINPSRGTFAYQLKSVCPEITCLLSGSPYSLLCSAVYLLTTFPGAQALFLTEEGSPATRSEWEQADFVFVAAESATGLGLNRLELLVDFDRFGRLPGKYARPYLRRAFELDCPYVYSVSRRGAQPDDSDPTRRVLGERYWPHPIVLETEPALQSAASSHELPALTHLVGWKRVLV